VPLEPGACGAGDGSGMALVKAGAAARATCLSSVSTAAEAARAPRAGSSRSCRSLMVAVLGVKAEVGAGVGVEVGVSGRQGCAENSQVVNGCGQPGVECASLEEAVSVAKGVSTRECTGSNGRAKKQTKWALSTLDGTVDFGDVAAARAYRYRVAKQDARKGVRAALSHAHVMHPDEHRDMHSAALVKGPLSRTVHLKRSTRSWEVGRYYVVT
jgi:hypothetical protein